MLDFWTALNSGMGRRFLLALGVAMIAMLIAVGCLVGRETASRQESAQRTRLDQAASGFASGVSARLAAADAVLEVLVSSDAGTDGQILRERLVASRTIKSVLLAVPDAQGIARSNQFEFKLTRAQTNTLRTGGSAVMAVSIGDGLTGVYLARAVRAAGSSRIGFFEVAPDWLWAPVLDVADELEIVAFDSTGALLYQTGTVARDLSGLFRAGMASPLRPGSTRNLGWQSGGVAWTGSLASLSLVDAFTSPAFAVVVASRNASLWSRLQPVAEHLPILLAFGALVSLLAAALLSRSYVPALRGFRRALLNMRDGKLIAMTDPYASDEVLVAMDTYNRAVVNVDRQMQTLRTLGAIDTLLLNSGDLEAVLDRVLARIREVTHCRAAGVTLIDADAPGYGRLFVASSDEAQLPVSRVTLDAMVVETFVSSPDGLTIARAEEERHSFLMPLTQMGAQFFWAWPVFAGDRLAAILAVGYGEAPRLDALLAGYGTECARRLGGALSASARAEALYRQAHFDPLTSLPNRLLFRDRLAQELSTVAGSASRGALLYIDLDHFKKVNDSLGHAAGDQLLAITGQRLRSCVKDGDTVARLAGDEFTVILRQVADPDAAHTVAARIIDSLQMPVNIAGQDHQVRASIGITLFPDDGISIDDLMRNADLAMYRAKHLGRGAAVFYDRKMVSRETRVPDSGLYRALKRREFSLFYQPQYSLMDGSLLGVEALLRWESPRGGMRSPAEFVPAAEECGLIVDIGSWVLDAACAQLASWREQGLAPPRVAVNISAQQLRDPGFPGLARRLLDKYQLAADMIELELTEVVFADQESEQTLQALSRMGLRLTLDDFGTGYSALTHLRRYPVQTVK
ncbi:MAG: EAL domain-containing protein, partial [Pseudomonadota bacterium]